MNKKFLISAILILIAITFAGCSQPVIYSEMYEGVPIYPESILSDSSEYREYYKISEFNGTFTEVNEFFLKNIDYDIWTVKENPLQFNGEYSFIGSLSSQGYILKDSEREVSLVIQRAILSEDGTGYLDIIINGSPFKEGKFEVNGESEHWNASLEYIITKERIRINGSANYIGNTLPKIIETEFLYHQIMEGQHPIESASEKTTRGERERSLIEFNTSYKREYELEIQKEGINNGYIEIKWKEDGEIKIEKIELNVVQEN